jgi:hypothetical protein
MNDVATPHDTFFCERRDKGEVLTRLDQAD